jgi:SAM-dependent methyltransferase
MDGRIAGRRVLVIGGEVVKDAQAFNSRGAGYVLGCVEPGQQGAPEDVGQPGIDLRSVGWQGLDPDAHGTFDLVLCNDLLHRVAEPLTLLRKLRALTSGGGTLLIGAMLIDDPERSEYLRFVPDRFAGDPSWWFVPGPLAFHWLVQSAGFEVEAEFAQREGPRDLFPVVSAYLRATAS